MHIKSDDSLYLYRYVLHVGGIQIKLMHVIQL